jgi:pSer/pThr/pTyr-binding forkhead associated (FHA) protein
MKVNLIFIKKDGSTEFFSLPSSVTLLGRRQDCDFCIPLSCVSRRHCEINLDQGKVTVRDMRSRNGTLINGKHIEEASMNAGDVLKIGPIEFVLQIDGVPEDLEPYLPQAESAQKTIETCKPERYSTDETQEAEYSLEQDLAELDPGRSQTTDFDHGLSGFDLEDGLDMDAEISNL